MIPTRAIMVSPPRLHSISTSIAVCHSGRSDSLFGRLVMWVAASLRVTSFRPSGRTIASANSRAQFVLIPPALLVKLGFEPDRQTRGIVGVSYIADRARRAGSAAPTSLLSGPRRVRMSFAHPASAIAEFAFHQATPIRAAGKSGLTSAPRLPHALQTKESSISDSLPFTLTSCRSLATVKGHLAFEAGHRHAH